MAGYRHEPKNDTYNNYEYGSPHPVTAREEYDSQQDVFGNEEGATVSIVFSNVLLVCLMSLVDSVPDNDLASRGGPHDSRNR